MWTDVALQQQLCAGEVAVPARSAKGKSWLAFYSLYMHLAPVSDYPSSPCYKVRDGHGGILLRQYKNGQYGLPGNDSNLMIVFYVQIMPDDLVMQLHRF